MVFDCDLVLWCSNKLRFVFARHSVSIAWAYFYLGMKEHLDSARTCKQWEFQDPKVEALYHFSGHISGDIFSKSALINRPEILWYIPPINRFLASMAIDVMEFLATPWTVPLVLIRLQIGIFHEVNHPFGDPPVLEAMNPLRHCGKEGAHSTKHFGYG